MGIKGKLPRNFRLLKGKLEILKENFIKRFPTDPPERYMFDTKQLKRFCASLEQQGYEKALSRMLLIMCELDSWQEKAVRVCQEQATLFRSEKERLMKIAENFPETATAEVNNTKGKLQRVLTKTKKYSERKAKEFQNVVDEMLKQFGEQHKPNTSWWECVKCLCCKGR